MAGSPTMRRRRLAAELRRLRQSADLTIDDVAEHLGWQTSKISRIENRKIGINSTDLRKLLDFYEVTDSTQRETLMELGRRATERGWWQAYGAAIPSEYGTLIGLEAEASEIRTYQPEVIYGLLQTGAYARAVIRAGYPLDTSEEIDQRVEIRLARQEILTRDNPTRVHVVLSEGAVRRQVGGSAIMREQLLHLTADRDRSNVITQILPFRAGEHAAMAGSFVLLDFPEVYDLGAVHIESATSSLTLEKRSDLQVYADMFARVQADALGPKESRDMLRSVAEEFAS